MFVEYYGIMSEQTVQNKEINDIAHRQVMAALREILSDPDRGMVLKSGAIRRLKTSMRSKEAGKTKNLTDVLAAYGV